MTLLVAGHETTATALAWTFERLIRTPRRARPAAAEEAAADGDYLDAVVKETLRLRPVVPAVVRRLQAPMEFGGWELPAGVNIAPSIYLLHRRADIYPDPLAFRPERFLGDDPPGHLRVDPLRRRRPALPRARASPSSRCKIVLAGGAAAISGCGAEPGRRRESVTRRAITFAPTRGGRVVVDAA